MTWCVWDHYICLLYMRGIVPSSDTRVVVACWVVKSRNIRYLLQWGCSTVRLILETQSAALDGGLVGDRSSISSFVTHLIILLERPSCHYVYPNLILVAKMKIGIWEALFGNRRIVSIFHLFMDRPYITTLHIRIMHRCWVRRTITGLLISNIEFFASKSPAVGSQIIVDFWEICSITRRCWNVVVFNLEDRIFLHNKYLLETFFNYQSTPLTQQNCIALSFLKVWKRMLCDFIISILVRSQMTFL